MSGPSERDEITADREALAEVLLAVDTTPAERAGMPFPAVAYLIEANAGDFADAVLASEWLAERDRRTAVTAVREALGSDEEPDMLRAMLLDASDRLANPRHRGNEHAWPKHAAMFRHLADRIERGE